MRIIDSLQTAWKSPLLKIGMISLITGIAFSAIGMGIIAHKNIGLAKLKIVSLELVGCGAFILGGIGATFLSRYQIKKQSIPPQPQPQLSEKDLLPVAEAAVLIMPSLIEENNAAPVPLAIQAAPPPPLVPPVLVEQPPPYVAPVVPLIETPDDGRYFTLDMVDTKKKRLSYFNDHFFVFKDDENQFCMIRSPEEKGSEPITRPYNRKDYAIWKQNYKEEEYTTTKHISLEAWDS